MTGSTRQQLRCVWESPLALTWHVLLLQDPVCRGEGVVLSAPICTLLSLYGVRNVPPGNEKADQDCDALSSWGIQWLLPIGAC